MIKKIDASVLLTGKIANSTTLELYLTYDHIAFIRLTTNFINSVMIKSLPLWSSFAGTAKLNKTIEKLKSIV